MTINFIEDETVINSVLLHEEGVIKTKQSCTHYLRAH